MDCYKDESGVQKFFVQRTKLSLRKVLPLAHLHLKKQNIQCRKITIMILWKYDTLIVWLYCK